MKKHILIISLHADPMLPAGIGEYGGGHMYPYELLVGLSKKDYIVSLITRKIDKTLPDIEYINKSSTIYRLDYGDVPFQDKKDFHNLRDVSLSLTCRLLKKYDIRPNIIHSLYWNSGYLAYQLSQQLKIPYVHSPISIGYIIKKEQAKEIEPHRITIEQKVFENASKILSITESEKENIIKYYNIKNDSIEVIGRPVPQEYLYPIHDEWGNIRDCNMNYIPSPTPSHLYPMPIDRNWWQRKAFIYVGRIHSNKGIHYIIKAWVELKEKYKETCPPLWIVGGSPEEINQFHIEQNLNLDCYEKSSEIIWWGRLNAEGISTLYTRSLVLIMHSKYEPGGRVSTEAMSAGIPVIATPCGFAKDMVKDWKTGFLVDFGDIDQLAHRMSMFILQPYLANSLGYNAKEVALRTAQKWNFMEHHIYIYEQLTSAFDTLKLNFSPVLKENESVWGIVNTYPFHFTEVTDDYIQHQLETLGIEGIFLKKQHENRFLGCHLWTAINNSNEYYIIQPYNLVNIRRLLDVNRYSSIIYANSTYQRIKKWANIFSTSLISFDDRKQIIIGNGTPLTCYETQDYTNIIQFIAQHKYAISSKAMKDFNKLLNETSDIAEILTHYQRFAEEDRWFSEDDFSISVESKWLLNKISEDGTLNSFFQPQIIQLMKKNCNRTRKIISVLGGFIYPGSICKQNGNLNISALTSIHYVENGYDEGQLLVYFGQRSYDIIHWHNLVKKIPIECRQQAVQWALILLSKKLILAYTMAYSSSKLSEIQKHLEILGEISLSQNY